MGTREGVKFNPPKTNWRSEFKYKSEEIL